MKLPSLIRWISAVACAVFALSFGMFVWDELGTASTTQTVKATYGTPAVVTRDAHGRIIGEPPARWRYEIDSLSDRLTAPGEDFASHIAATPSPWAMRGFALIFGVLVFGFGLRMGANWVESSRFMQRRPIDPETGFTPGYR